MFHPDRFDFKGTTVAEALLKEGVYRNQFETGLSSGSMSAFPGGERDRWENTLFAGAYHVQGVTGSERPKYGPHGYGDIHGDRWPRWKLL
jgi:hypothetical protein